MSNVCNPVYFPITYSYYKYVGPNRDQYLLKFKRNNTGKLQKTISRQAQKL